MLAKQQEQFVAFGGAGGGYRLVPSFALLAQFYGHTRLYEDSDINALSSPGGQLVFGGRITVASHLSMDLAVQEDVPINSSPGFGIHVGLNYH